MLYPSINRNLQKLFKSYYIFLTCVVTFVYNGIIRFRVFHFRKLSKKKSFMEIGGKDANQNYH